LARAFQAGLEPSGESERAILELTSGQLLLMPSATTSVVGLKAVTVAAGNPSRGRPRIQGAYLLFDSETLELRVIPGDCSDEPSDVGFLNRGEQLGSEPERTLEGVRASCSSHDRANSPRRSSPSASRAPHAGSGDSVKVLANRGRSARTHPDQRRRSPRDPRFLHGRKSEASARGLREEKARPPPVGRAMTSANLGADVLCQAVDLTAFGQSVLRAIGMQGGDAQYMATQIVASDLAGHESHGMRRLPKYVARARQGWADPIATPIIELDLGALVRLNGQAGFGHVVMRDATAIAVERARSHGIAAVAVHNCEYAGRFADFCEYAASKGVVTLLFVNDGGAGQDVAPPGGLEGRLSTNPVAAGVPRSCSPHLVLDMATSSVAMGRLSEWRDRGESVPPDWVTTTGALQHFGGIKGFGLALIAEALGGALTTAGTVTAAPTNKELQGVFLIAIDVGHLRNVDEFTAEVDAFTSYIADTPLAPGAAPIQMPGEHSAETAKQRAAHGVPIRSFTWHQMARLADELGLALPAHQAWSTSLPPTGSDGDGRIT
jgi:uncharacterized oxidoreductase